MAMVESKLSSFGEMLRLQHATSTAIQDIRNGENSIGAVRTSLSTDPRGPEYFDFEIIKFASLLASDQGIQIRTDADWPYPEIWGGDATAFPLPY